MAFRYFETEHISQALRAIISGRPYVCSEKSSNQELFTIFSKSLLSVSVFKSPSFLRLGLDSIQATVKMPYTMSVPTAFEAQLYFHSLVLISREVGKKKPNKIHISVNSTFFGMAARILQNVWHTLRSYCLPGSLQVFIEPYALVQPFLDTSSGIIAVIMWLGVIEAT